MLSLFTTLYVSPLMLVDLENDEDINLALISYMTNEPIIDKSNSNNLAIFVIDYFRICTVKNRLPTIVLSVFVK
jgi:hypothetical protein